MSDERMDEEEIDELDDADIVFSLATTSSRLLSILWILMTDSAVFNREKDESSIFDGVPCLMRSAQKVINASWRMMMDNAGLSVADQLVINKELLHPADDLGT